ncbi:hypothetical protein [Larkinella ripae]
MTKRVRILVGLLTVLAVESQGQCVVTEDKQKRVVTICQGYTAPLGLLVNRTDRKQSLSQTVYLGSEYLTYPVWQHGSLEFGNRRNAISCQIAYNLLTSQVLCQFEGDSVIRTVTPDAFTINDIHFVSQLNSKGDRTYYRVLYAGKIRLLAQYKCSLRRVEKEPYTLDQAFDGTYNRQKSFFIQRDDQPLRRVGLSRKSLLDALDGTPDKLPDYLTKKKLTIYELVDAVAYYDGFAGKSLPGKNL